MVHPCNGSTQEDCLKFEAIHPSFRMSKASHGSSETLAQKGGGTERVRGVCVKEIGGERVILV